MAQFLSRRYNHELYCAMREALNTGSLPEVCITLAELLEDVGPEYTGAQATAISNAMQALDRVKDVLHEWEGQ